MIHTAKPFLQQLYHVWDHALCRRGKAEAIAICPKTPEMEAKFATLPQGAEELEDKITEAEARLEGILLNNPGVMNEFKARQKKINEQKKRLEDTITWLTVQRSEMQDIRVSPCARHVLILLVLEHTFCQYFGSPFKNHDAVAWCCSLTRTGST